MDCSMAVPDQHFERLLDRIYDAATEQELWRPLLTEIADLTGPRQPSVGDMRQGGRGVSPQRRTRRCGLVQATSQSEMPRCGSLARSRRGVLSRKSQAVMP